MEQLVVLDGDKYIINNDEYSDMEIDSLRKKLGKSIKVILLNNSIFIQCFKNVNTSGEKYIEDEYIGRIAFDNNTLLHYEYLKKIKILYVYSINDGGNVKKLLPNIFSLKIIPIQFIIHNYVRRKFKSKFLFSIITIIKDKIHIISCENGIIVSCEILKVEDFNMQNISCGNYSNKSIVVDKKVIDFIPENKVIKEEIIILDIGGYLNDKIFKI